MIVKLEKPAVSAHLFSGCTDTIIASGLENVMGDIYGDDKENPGLAAVCLGDFVIFAGEASETAVRAVLEIRGRQHMILIPGTDEWESAIEAALGGRVKKFSRYAIKKEPDVFDRTYLKGIVDKFLKEQTACGYTLHLIDEPLYGTCLKEEWSRDLVGQFSSYSQFEEMGLGVLALKDGFPVSGAASYSAYKGGIEIEIDTREDFRRQGLALVCGARLILECLDRDLYPSWDAHTLASVALAEKLGYHLSHEYTAYEYTAGE